MCVDVCVCVCVIFEHFRVNFETQIDHKGKIILFLVGSATECVKLIWMSMLDYVAVLDVLTFFC